MNEKLKTLLACIPESPFKGHLIVEIEEQQKRIAELESEVERKMSAGNYVLEQLTTAQQQNARLISDMDRLYKMLLSEPDTKGALFKAENILRELIAEHGWVK